MSARQAIDIHRHFLSLADWTTPERTVDRIIMGDPEKHIRKILVTWISSFDAVRIAVQRGFDMLITHEPTFWSHLDEAEVTQASKIGRSKKRFIEEAGLVILRNHDVWDRMPEIGITWAWGRFLGLGSKPVDINAQGYQHRYDIHAVPLDTLARKIAKQTAILGDPVVQVIGDGSREVSKVAIGAGCICDPLISQEMGCDVSIVCDDGSRYWGNIQYALDSNHPIIRVNHGISEEPGMVTLTQYINDNLPGLSAEHLPYCAAHRLIGSQ